MSKLLIILLISFIYIDCIKEKLVNLKLNLEKIETKTVGKKGTLIALFTQYDKMIFANSQKEECFDSIITDGSNNYNVRCGLWNSKKTSEEIYIFCNIEEKIPVGIYEILFETKPFTYREYNVTLNVNKEEISPKFEKVDKNIVDLYSDTQTIIIENSVDSYELKFNIVSYNQEKLFFNHRTH